MFIVGCDETTKDGVHNQRGTGMNYDIWKGAKVMDDETIDSVTPPFTRLDGKSPRHIPRTVAGFDALKTLPKDFLFKQCLMGDWDGDGLLLFPGDWFDHIPEGYVVTDINGEEEAFHKKTSDTDIRFGCLAYGIICEHITEKDGV